MCIKLTETPLYEPGTQGPDLDAFSAGDVDTPTLAGERPGGSYFKTSK